MVIHIQKESSLSLFFLWKTKGWVKSKSQMCSHVVHGLYQSQLLFLKETPTACQSRCSSWFSCHCLLVRAGWLCSVQSLVLRWFTLLQISFHWPLKFFSCANHLMNIILGTAVDKTLPNSLWNKRKCFCKICYVPSSAKTCTLMVSFSKMILSSLFFSSRSKWGVWRG